VNAASLLAALEFASLTHGTQRREDVDASPYVNHLIAVARVMADAGGVTDEPLLVAAVLHDTVEDTKTTSEELEAEFGATVAGLVAEMTDDKSLPKEERKRLQIVHAPHASPGAKQLKIADKIANINDLISRPPARWTLERKLDYLAWAGQVVAGCRGVNPRLDTAFDDLSARARRVWEDTR
jgi:(p)ppGpp synthase/HD superfamily hydrolase